MLQHRVIDPVAHLVPLDPIAVVAFAIAFVVFAVASIRRPAYGVAALIVCIPFDFPHDVGHTTITFGKVAIVAVAAGIALGRRSAAALGRPAARAFVLAGCAVVAATALSIAHATYRGPALRETFKALEYLTVFALAAVAWAADPDARVLRRTIVWVTLAVSAIALAQEIFGAPSGIWFDNVAIPRIAGPLEGPNQLAGYLGMMLALLVAFALREPGSRLEPIALGSASAALVLTISRTGLFASALGVAVVFALAPETRRKPVLAALGIGVATGALGVALQGFLETYSFGGLGLLGRYSTLAEAASPGAVGTRSQLWHAAYVLWRTSPIFGIGAGNFENELGRAGYPQLHTHANSLYIQSLVEGGIPLLLATLALVYLSIARLARGPFADPLVLGTLGASAGLAAHQIFDFLSFYPKVGDQWWLLLALAAVRIDAARERHACA